MKKQSKSCKSVEKNCIDVVDIKLDESSSSSDSDGHRNIKVRLLLFVNKYIGKKDVSSFIPNSNYNQHL